MNYSRVTKIVWIVAGSMTLFVFLLILFIRVNLFGWFGELPSLDVLENPKSEIATEIYSSDGVLLGKYYRDFNRSPVEYSQLPKVLIDALIATEDVRFEEHSGVDIKGIFAIAPSLLRGQRRGSSTLTQQLAKNLFSLRKSGKYQGPLSGNIIVQKIKEWIIAIQIEKSYTKNEIMVMYLNTVEFGSKAHGIKSACKRFFNTTPDKLTVEQAALLVGLLKGPSFYNPIKYTDRAFNRRNTVLDQMLKYNKLSQTNYEKAVKKPLKLTLTDEDNSGLAIHFRSYYLKPYLEKWCEKNNMDLYEDGLKVYTTIDSRMQKIAEWSVNTHMKYLQKEFNTQWAGQSPWVDDNHQVIKNFPEKMLKKSDRYKELRAHYGDDENAIMKELKTPVRTTLFTWNGPIDTLISPMDSVKYMLRFLHTGFMSMNPHSGEIKAWVGDIDGRFFKYDHVKQSKRQPGSTFKPVIYSYAVEMKGFTPETQVMDVPQTYNRPGGTWTPKNSNGKYSNTYMTLRQALAQSVNTVSAFLMRQVDAESEAGMDSLHAYAQRLGIKSPLDKSITLCLGTSDVSVYEMVSAYSVFANEGIYVTPIFVTRIEDKYGNLLEEFKTSTSQVLTERTAYTMVELLQGSVEEEGGTSVALRSKFIIPGQIGGKTGTTQSSSDGWFIGIAPDLVSGCWVGGETRSIRFKSMNLGQGAKMALPIWGWYMQKVYEDHSLGLTNYEFKKPDGITPTEQGDVSMGQDIPEVLPEEDSDTPDADDLSGFNSK